MILAGGVGIVDCETVDDEVGFELDGKDAGAGAGACATTDGIAAETGASALRDVTWCRAISSAVCLEPPKHEAHRIRSASPLALHPSNPPYSTQTASSTPH